MIARQIEIHRSFSREIEQALSGMREVQTRSLGIVSHGGRSWPLLCAQDREVAPGRLPVLISAGVHGNEPAGIYAVLEFLRDRAAEFRQTFQFVVFPCVNPSGFEANTLESMSGANLNRCFGCDSREPEVRLIEQWLKESGIRFRATFDLHEAPPEYVGEGFVESDNPPGTWLYETVTDGSARLGRRMIAALPDTCEVCEWPTIYNDINDGGVVTYPNGCRNAIYAKATTLDAYLNGRSTGHSFTTETPTDWPIDRRIQAHLTYLTTALDVIAESVRGLLQVSREG